MTMEDTITKENQRELDVTLSDLVYRLNTNLPKLQRGVLYTLEELVAEYPWDKVSEKHARILRADFKEEAILGWLKVEFVETSIDQVHHYKLK